MTIRPPELKRPLLGAGVAASAASAVSFHSPMSLGSFSEPEQAPPVGSSTFLVCSYAVVVLIPCLAWLCRPLLLKT